MAELTTAIKNNFMIPSPRVDIQDPYVPNTLQKDCQINSDIQY
jgi:hypothetical protein